MNWMSILGIFLIVIGTIFSFIGTYKSDKKSQDLLTSKIQEKNQTIDSINVNNIKLIDQNTSLLKSNNDVSTSNWELIGQNKDMLLKIDRYQKEIEERDKRIRDLENETKNIKEFSYYATLDIYGRQFNARNGLTFTSDLSDKMSKVLFEKEGKVFVKPDKANLPILDEVIEKYPNFPFGYFAKYNTLMALGDPNWKIYAKKAVDIFEITTTIKGHNASHDEALKFARNDLKSNR